jgi:hypothetical protein
MIFLRALFVVVLLLFQNYLIGQSSSKILYRPKEYDKPLNSYPLNQHIAKKGELFTALSDRNDNTLYTTASKESPNGKKLSFLQPLVVLAEEGDFFKVADYKDENIVKNTIKSPNILGFIEKSKLLLWKNAIRNEKGFVIKALSVIKDGNVFLDPKRFIDDGDKIICYTAPNSNVKYIKKDAEVKIFKFLYVCKEDKESNMLLLAKASRFSIETSNRILGWVSKDIIQIWEDRLCLEPNFDKTAIDDRKLKNVAPSVNITLDGAKMFKKTPSVKEGVGLISLASESNERWLPTKKRMPIFNYDKTLKICETGYFTPILNETGEAVIPDSIWYKLLEDLNQRKLLLRNVNIVFVIDGSPAMSAYINSVINAISTLNKDLSPDRKSLYKLEFGAVVYRNKEDTKCPTVGDVSVSKIGLSADFQEVSDFLTTQKPITGCNDNVVPKALNKGIYEGLKLFDTKLGQYESNYIILIGGAADQSVSNEKGGISQNDLVNLYSKVGANMFVFQNRKLDIPAYLMFQPKMVDLMKKGNESMLNAAKDIKSKENTIKPVEWTNKASDSYYSFHATENDKFVKYAEITWPEIGGALDETIFLKEMDGFIKRITARLQNELENIIPDAPNKSSALTNSMAVLISKMNTKVSEKDIIAAFSGKNYQFFGRCYAPMEAEGLKEPLFQRVLFFTDDELSDLAKTLDQLSVSLDDIEQTRIQLKNTCIELALSYLGKSETKDISLDDLLEAIIGKEPRNRIFSSIKSINDLSDSKKVTDKTIKDIATQFSSKSRQLKEVKADDSFRCKEDIDLVYYWVPEKYLP